MRAQPPVTVLLLSVISLSSADSAPAGEQVSTKRVPAEWEPQEAIWLQWPGPYEKAHEVAFAKMASVIAEYERLHILHDSSAIREGARTIISSVGGDPDHENIVWHAIPNDSAWMRDNGPVYVIDGGEMRIQNWKFNAWGGAFGSAVSYGLDDQVPSKVGEYLAMPVDDVDIVHERGNLEFNGLGTVILNWSTLGDPKRNPGYSKAQAEADLQHHFGVSKIVWIEGVPEGDLTKGHIDGIARFIDPTTVVVAECTANSYCQPDDGTDAIYDAAAATIEAAGLTVIRDPIEGVANFAGEVLNTKYMNWIVGNGFVIVGGFDNPITDAAAKSRIESYFPGRQT